MRANVSEDDVRSFSNTVRDQQEKAREMSEKIRSMAKEAQNQIMEESQKAQELIAQCTEELAGLNSQIENLTTQLEQLSSQLSTIPPKIKKVYVDKDGNEHVVEVDNPAYLAMVAQINAVRGQLQQLQNKVKEIQSKKEELEMQAASLRATYKSVGEIAESVGGCEYTTEELSSAALIKLKALGDIIAEYNGIKIEGLPNKLFGVDIDDDMRNVMENAPESKSAMQKMSDYLKKHDYGMGDSDKYMQDPEWKALNEAVADEIEAQEREIARRYGEIVVDENRRNLSEDNTFDKKQVPISFADDLKFNDDSSFGFAKIDIPKDRLTSTQRKRRVFGWIGLVCAAFGLSVSVGMKDVEAWSPDGKNTEMVVFKEDENGNKVETQLVVELDSIENIIKFYGEKCMDFAEEVAEIAKKEKELMDSIKDEKNEFVGYYDPHKVGKVNNVNNKPIENYRSNKKIWR